MLRVSYARTLESPFNENLVLSSIGCANPAVGALFFAEGEGCATPAGVSRPLQLLLLPAFAMNFMPDCSRRSGNIW